MNPLILAILRSEVVVIVTDEQKPIEPPMQTMMIENVREHDMRMFALPEKHERREGREKPRRIDPHRYRK